LDYVFMFVRNTTTTSTYKLSLHDALPFSSLPGKPLRARGGCSYDSRRQPPFVGAPVSGANTGHPVSANAPRSQRDKGGGVVEGRSEEHTSELQSRENLVCRLLLL